MKRQFCALLLALLVPIGLTSGAAWAQNSWPTPGNSYANGAVAMCVNTSGQAVPCTPSPGIPAGSTAITNSNTGTTAAVSATLAGVSGKTTYICGFTITSGGTTAALAQNATVAGTISGTMNFTYVDVSSGQGLLGIAFPICLPASGQNTSIVVTAPAGGTGTVAAVSTWGYQF